MIEIEQVSKVYSKDVYALREVSLTIESGEWILICGPNGAGKTTLLRVLATLITPSAGRVRISGLDLNKDATAVRRRIGFVSHAPLLYGDLTVKENLRFYAAMYDVPQERIQAALNLVSMTDKQDTPVRTLSRGMTQRLSIARALLHEPPILLLDEPYTGLDPEAVEWLEALLAAQVRDGRTVVMSTHNLTRGLGAISQAVVLDKGQVAAQIKIDLSLDRLTAVYEQTVGRTR